MTAPDRSDLTHFDHWLDAMVSGTPALETDVASDSTTDPATSRDVRDAAVQFHELAARADRTAHEVTTHARLDTIWEGLMDAHMSPTTTVNGHIGPGEARSVGIGRNAIERSPAPLGRFQPLINATVAAALILALATGIWRAGGEFDLGFGGDGNGPSTRLAGQVTEIATPEARTPLAALPTDGTLLLNPGTGIVSRPLDGSPGITLESKDSLDPPTYTRTNVPNVTLSTYDQIARNVRTGEVLRTNPYDNSIIIGPFWVQYPSQDPAVPAGARIVDLRTIETAEFFDLAGVDPVNVGAHWLIEGTASGTLGVGVVNIATESGPPITPTMLLIDGNLERARAVSLWAPAGTDGDVLAVSPDGSLVAYPTGTTGNVAIQIETISGELIQRIPWSGEQPIDRLILTDAGTLVTMAEGGISTVNVRQGANPLPIAAYPDEIQDVVLSPDGSHLLFATLDPLSDPNVAANTAWHMLDIGTGELTPLPQVTGGSRIGVGQPNETGKVMLWVPFGTLAEGTYRVLFVDVATGAVTAAQPMGVSSVYAPGAPISEDGAVFATFGGDLPENPRYKAKDPFSSFPLNGQLAVFDAASQSVVTIPMPEISATEIEPSLIVSPDGRHLVLSVRWTDPEGEQTQSWVTTTDGASGWTPIEGGLVIQWLTA